MAAQKKKGGRAPSQSVKLQTVLGQVVRARRRELEMAQGDLGTKLRVSPATASKIEGGQQDVSFDQLWRLALVLELPASELLIRVEKAVEVLRRNGVKLVVTRAEQAESSGGEITAVALGGILGFLLARAE